jgi:putative membrane protein (TIGR04086 family)
MKSLKLNVSPTVKHVTRGSLYAIISTLLLVLVFAVFIFAAGLDGAATKPIAQIIKVASIFFGVYIALKHIEKNGWLWGGVIGLIYTVLAFFVFSIVDSTFSITGGLITDMLFACAIGVISAVLLKVMQTKAV